MGMTKEKMEMYVDFTNIITELESQVDFYSNQGEVYYAACMLLTDRVVALQGEKPDTHSHVLCEALREAERIAEKEKKEENISSEKG